MTSAKDANPPPIVYTLAEMFEKFSKYQDPKSDGKTMTLSQSDKWMKQAELFGVGKKMTLTDTGVCFLKFKQRAISYADYERFLMDLSRTKSLDYPDLIFKLTNCGLPGLKPGELPDDKKKRKK